MKFSLGVSRACAMATEVAPMLISATISIVTAEVRIRDSDELKCESDSTETVRRKPTPATPMPRIQILEKIACVLLPIRRSSELGSGHLWRPGQF